MLASQPETVAVKEAARLTGLAPWRVRRWMSMGILEQRRYHGNWRPTRDGIEQMAAILKMSRETAP